MKAFKVVLKLVGSLCVGALIGLAISFIIIVAFTETSASEFAGKILKTNLSEILLAALVGIASFIISIPLNILIHEGGHLVCGLISGYKFVSFRILNYALIRKDGKLSIKHFSVEGTGGQCLLTPPVMDDESKTPIVLYNLGGVLANILSILLVLPVFWTDMHPYVFEFAALFILLTAIMVIMNGIPMQQTNGISNDGMNVIQLRKSPASLHGMIAQLRANALIQEGIRPKDMPDELFTTHGPINYRNAIEVSIPLMAASRLLDQRKIEEAHISFQELYSHRSEIMPLYVKEITGELIFTSLVMGDKKKAEELYDKDTQKYIKQYSKVMSSKQRILFAIALFMENDHKKAKSIYASLLKQKDEYMLQGEVESDLAIMESLIKTYMKSF